MARGYDGAFGRKVNSPWVWIPLAVMFVVPFVDPRRPLRMLHLDLLVLSAFGVSVAFFNAAKIGISVPIVYPLLAYLLGRALWIGLRRERPRPALKPLVPVRVLAIALVFLVAFRITLNVLSSNVIDVGYAGVIGADRIVDGTKLYGNFPADNQHGDTYGPVNYVAYVPFEQVWPWSGRWDDLPAAHAASIAFDLICLVLVFLVGNRVRGPDLGVMLAYAWAAFPFTLYAMDCNVNDALVGALVLVAMLATAKPVRRGVWLALAGMAKFAPLALGPLLMSQQPRRTVRFALAFAATLVVAALPILLQGRYRLFYDRTLGFQAARDAPFSVWGLWGWPGALRALVQLGAVVFAVVVALVPRRRDVVGLAALAGAVLIALQLGATYWFYLYVIWFLPLALVAFIGRDQEPTRSPVPAPEPARSRPLSMAASSG
jgi:hypothetical protein